MKQLIAIRSKLPWKAEMAHHSPKGTEKGHYFGLRGRTPMQDWGTKFGEVKLRDFFDEGGIIYMQNFRKPDWKEVDPEDLLKIPTNIIVELYLEPTNKITSRMVESAVKIGNKYAMTDRERQKKFPRLTPHKCKQCGNIFANDEDARQSKVICQECRELK